MVVFISNHEQKNFKYYLDLLSNKYSDNDDEDLSKLDFLEFQNNIFELQDDFQETKANLDDLKSLYSEVEKLNKDLKSKLVNSEVEYQKMFEEYNDLLKENRSLDKKSHDSSVKIKYYEKKLSRLEKKLKDSSILIDELTRDKDYFMATLDKLSSVISLLDANDVIDLSEIDIGSNLKDSPYYRLLDKSKLLDKDWYKKTYLNNENIDPVEHYLRVGYLLGYNPSPNFDADWYCLNKPELKCNNINPLVDYLLYGVNEGLTPVAPYSRELIPTIKDSQEYALLKDSAIIDEDWYLNEYGLENVDVIEHYLTTGLKQENRINQNTRIEYHQSNYESIIEYFTKRDEKEIDETTPSISPIQDSIEYQIIKDSDYFDKEYYTKTNNLKEVDPLEHFLTEGTKSNFNPNKNLDIITYISQYNVNKEEINPLVHYILYNEGKIIEATPEKEEIIYDNRFYQEYMMLENSKYFDADYYRKHNPNITRDIDPTEYFLT